MANNVAYTGNNRATFCSPVKDPFVIVSNLLIIIIIISSSSSSVSSSISISISISVNC